MWSMRVASLRSGVLHSAHMPPDLSSAASTSAGAASGGAPIQPGRRMPPIALSMYSSRRRLHISAILRRCSPVAPSRQSENTPGLPLAPLRYVTTP